MFNKIIRVIIFLLFTLFITYGVMLGFDVSFSASPPSAGKVISETSFQKWLPIILNLVVLLVGISITFERGRGNLKRLEERFISYIETDKARLDEFISEVCKWQEKHEKANAAAMERIDRKIDRVDSRIRSPEGRPHFAYREELEYLREGQQALRTELKKDGKALREEIKEDMKGHFKGVKSMIESMMKEVRSCFQDK